MSSPSASTVEPAVSEIPLVDLVAGSGILLPDCAIDHLVRFRDLLHERNQVVNLTAVREIPAIDRRLVIESLRLVPVLRNLVPEDQEPPVRHLDLGSGGGIPGMVLAIARPDLSVTLLDATRKKTDFLADVIRELGLPNATTLNGRAEELGHLPRWRNQFDLVTARAVAALPTILELGAPFLRTGGTMLLPKGTDLDDELVHAERAAPLLGMEIVSSDPLEDIGSTVETRLVIARKIATTPRTYPRRPGIPARSPLGSEPSGRAGRKGSDR